MKLTRHLTPQLLKIPLNATEKAAAITELVDLLVEQGVTSQRDELLAAVLEREAQRTTGIGREFAIPHAKTDAVKRLTIAFGRTQSPMEFGSIDGKPVRLIALLVTPTGETSTHIQALAQLSRLATNNSMMEGLLTADGPDAFHHILAEHDAKSGPA